MHQLKWTGLFSHWKFVLGSKSLPGSGQAYPIILNGFALNVHPDMDHYKMIVACGIVDKGVTSMSAVLGREVAIDEVKQRLIDQYGKIFTSVPKKISLEGLPWL